MLGGSLCGARSKFLPVSIHQALNSSSLIRWNSWRQDGLIRRPIRRRLEEIAKYGTKRGAALGCPGDNGAKRLPGNRHKSIELAVSGPVGSLPHGECL